MGNLFKVSPESVELIPLSGNTLDVDFNLTSRKFVITGNVSIKAEYVNPPATNFWQQNVDIILKGQDFEGNTVDVTTQTNAFGVYEITNLRMGRYTLRATKTAFKLDRHERLSYPQDLNLSSTHDAPESPDTLLSEFILDDQTPGVQYDSVNEIFYLRHIDFRVREFVFKIGFKFADSNFTEASKVQLYANDAPNTLLEEVTVTKGQTKNTTAKYQLGKYRMVVERVVSPYVSDDHKLTVEGNIVQTPNLFYIFVVDDDGFVVSYEMFTKLNLVFKTFETSSYATNFAMSYLNVKLKNITTNDVYQFYTNDTAELSYTDPEGTTTSITAYTIPDYEFDIDIFPGDYRLEFDSQPNNVTIEMAKGANFSARTRDKIDFTMVASPLEIRFSYYLYTAAVYNTMADLKLRLSVSGYDSNTGTTSPLVSNITFGIYTPTTNQKKIVASGLQTIYKNIKVEYESIVDVYECGASELVYNTHHWTSILPTFKKEGAGIFSLEINKVTEVITHYEAVGLTGTDAIKPPTLINFSSQIHFPFNSTTKNYSAFAWKDDDKFYFSVVDLTFELGKPTVISNVPNQHEEIIPGDFAHPNFVKTHELDIVNTTETIIHIIPTETDVFMETQFNTSSYDVAKNNYFRGNVISFTNETRMNVYSDVVAGVVLNTKLSNGRYFLFINGTYAYFHIPGDRIDGGTTDSNVYTRMDLSVNPITETVLMQTALTTTLVSEWRVELIKEDIGTTGINRNAVFYADTFQGEWDSLQEVLIPLQSHPNGWNYIDFTNSTRSNKVLIDYNVKCIDENKQKVVDSAVIKVSTFDVWGSPVLFAKPFNTKIVYTDGTEIPIILDSPEYVTGHEYVEVNVALFSNNVKIVVEDETSFYVVKINNIDTTNFNVVKNQTVELEIRQLQAKVRINFQINKGIAAELYNVATGALYMTVYNVYTVATGSYAIGDPRNGYTGLSVIDASGTLTTGVTDILVPFKKLELKVVAKASGKVACASGAESYAYGPTPVDFTTWGDVASAALPKTGTKMFSIKSEVGATNDFTLTVKPTVSFVLSSNTEYGVPFENTRGKFYEIVWTDKEVKVGNLYQNKYIAARSFNVSSKLLEAYGFKTDKAISMTLDVALPTHDRKNVFILTQPIASKLNYKVIETKETFKTTYSAIAVSIDSFLSGRWTSNTTTSSYGLVTYSKRGSCGNDQKMVGGSNFGRSIIYEPKTKSWDNVPHRKWFRANSSPSWNDIGGIEQMGVFNAWKKANPTKARLKRVSRCGDTIKVYHYVAINSTKSSLGFNDVEVDYEKTVNMPRFHIVDDEKEISFTWGNNIDATVTFKFLHNNFAWFFFEKYMVYDVDGFETSNLTNVYSKIDLDTMTETLITATDDESLYTDEDIDSTGDFVLRSGIYELQSDKKGLTKKSDIPINWSNLEFEHNIDGKNLITSYSVKCTPTIEMEA